MNARMQQAAWTPAALVVPVALSVALLPLRRHVDDVLVAVVLLAVSAAVLARAEWLGVSLGDEIEQGPGGKLGSVPDLARLAELADRITDNEVPPHRGPSS